MHLALRSTDALDAADTSGNTSSTERNNMSILHSERAMSGAALDQMTAQVAEFMEPRVLLRDGSLGYRATTIGSLTVEAPAGAPDAPVETIAITGAECELRVTDPVLTVDGALRFDYELSYLIGEGTSHLLFGEETKIRVLVGRGLDPMIRPTFGRLEIPAGVSMGEQAVSNVLEVYLVAETPIGRLHNREPARMVAQTTTIPPVGQPFHQEGQVPLYTEAGELVAIKHATMSTLDTLLPGAPTV
jgi:hypothetical protein